MADGFFGLGVGAAKLSELTTRQHRLGVRISNRLRRWPSMTALADTVHVLSTKAGAASHGLPQANCGFQDVTCLPGRLETR